MELRGRDALAERRVRLAERVPYLAAVVAPTDPHPEAGPRGVLEVATYNVHRFSGPGGGDRERAGAVPGVRLDARPPPRRAGQRHSFALAADLGVRARPVVLAARAALGDRGAVRPRREPGVDRGHAP